MKITLATDDGKHVETVYTEDIDFLGHSMNRVILKLRIDEAIKRIIKLEEKVHGS